MLQLSSIQKTIIFIAASLTTALTLQYMLNSNATATPQDTLMRPSTTLRAAMSNLTHAKIVPRRSAERGTADHGWLKTAHTFSFASYYDPRHEQFGALRVLNEDNVAPNQGFPTHPHRDAEIFSYILSGELTHRDSMQKKGAESGSSKEFFRMKRGDVQFTTGGTGIAHSEQNEHNETWVKFLQLWALPWKKGLPPNYHTLTFSEDSKRAGFVTIITPLKAGPKATKEDEKAAIPVKEGTIPIHADLVFSAGIIAPGKTFDYKIGGEDYITNKTDRKVYVHLPATQNGQSKIKLAGETVLNEGDGAYITKVNAADVLTVESVGTADAEVVVIDSN
jgi:quercetin 2,3-dioxygenase